MFLALPDGNPAQVGKSKGRWLEPKADFVFGGEDHEKDNILELGPHGFPRDWPDVYSESDALRSLIKKKGPCGAKRVSVVSSPSEADKKALLGDGVARHLQSFANALAVRDHAGLDIVEGWAIYDLLDEIIGDGFVAERYWWNTAADGTWVDVTPRPERLDQLLLVEAIAGARKAEVILTQKQHDLAQYLFQARFPTAAAAAAVKGTAPAAAPAEASEELKVLARRVKLGITEPVMTLLKYVEKDQSVCASLISIGLCGSLVPQLKKNAAAAARLLSILGRAAITGGLHDMASTSFLNDSGVEPLLDLLLQQDLDVAADAATSLACMCFQAPKVQARACKIGSLRSLVALLDRRDDRCAREASLALWHMQVGRKESSELALKVNAGAPLLALVTDASAPLDVRLNAAGALMHFSAAAPAQDALGQAGAVSALCALLGADQPMALRTQAAGALLNLVYRHKGNGVKAYKDGSALKSLVLLVEEGDKTAQEYASGAIANLLAGDSSFYGSAGGNADIAKAAIEAGAFEALVQFFQKTASSGASGDRQEVLSAVANMAKYLSADQVGACTDEVIEDLFAPILKEQQALRKETLSLLMNLGSHIQVKEKLLKLGIVKPLVKLLEDDDKVNRERAAGALANLMNGHSTTVRAIYSVTGSEVVKKMLEVLQNEISTTARRYAAQALAMLLTQDLPRKWAQKAKGMQVLATVIEEDQIAEAALALLNSAPAGKERRAWQRQLASFGVLPPLVQMLKHRVAASRCWAAGALLNLTQGSTNMSMQVLKAGALEPLFTLVCAAPETEMPPAREWAAGLLGNLARYGGKAAQAKVIEAEGVVESLVQLLITGDATTQEMVVFTLASLIEDDGGARIRDDLVMAASVLTKMKDECSSPLKEQVEDLLAAACAE